MAPPKRSFRGAYRRSSLLPRRHISVFYRRRFANYAPINNIGRARLVLSGVCSLRRYLHLQRSPLRSDEEKVLGAEYEGAKRRNALLSREQRQEEMIDRKLTNHRRWRGRRDIGDEWLYKLLSREQSQAEVTG